MCTIYKVWRRKNEDGAKINHGVKIAVMQRCSTE